VRGGADGPATGPDLGAMTAAEMFDLVDEELNSPDFE
jgi:hypothetical protein